MPLSRDDYKEAMRSAAAAGVAAQETVASFRWERLPMELVRVRQVLQRLEKVGRAAQDVLDQMEENDE